MKGRRWTAADLEELARLYAQGWSDAQLALMLCRPPKEVWRKRRKLKLGPALGKRGPAKGSWHHDLATRARISAANRARWADPAYRAAQLAKIPASLAKARAARKRWPKGWKKKPEDVAAQVERQKRQYASDPAYRERIRRMVEARLLSAKSAKVSHGV